MVLVAIVGLNCWAFRTILVSRSWTAVQVGIGNLPMANILIIVPLVSYPYRGGRQFLWGFEGFGAAAVVLKVALTILDGPWPPFWISYLRLVTDPLTSAWGSPQFWTNPQWLIGCPIVSLWVTLPQLAVALIGGFLFRMFWQPTRKQPSASSPTEIQNSVMAELQLERTDRVRMRLNVERVN
jgi:hypothetical protein